MKYFIKYLPVEGEIESHSMALLDAGFNNASIVRVMSTAKYYSNVSSEGNNWDVMTVRLKKLQLFLCSRDIQVGDSYHFDVGYASGEKIADQEDVTQLHLENNPFKVIGPISPKATWVKEGDEFEEDQVEEWFWHKNQKAFMFRVNEEWVPKFLEISKDKDWYERGYYMIKGPCGYFH